MKTELTCIVCPMGCQLVVEKEGNNIISVSGNTCKRGEVYAKDECTNPVRVITTTVKTKEGKIIPVKTDKPVPKAMIMDCMKEINSLCPDGKTGVSIGDVILENILNTGSDIVVSGK